MGREGLWLEGGIRSAMGTRPTSRGSREYSAEKFTYQYQIPPKLFMIWGKGHWYERFSLVFQEIISTADKF